MTNKKDTDPYPQAIHSLGGKGKMCVTYTTKILSVALKFTNYIISLDLHH